MSGDLPVAVSARLDRAREHFSSLTEVAARWVETMQGGNWFNDYDPDSGITTLLVQLPTPPISLSMIVSDVAHQSRAALDNLAYLLVTARGYRPPERNMIAFPIVADVASFNKTQNRSLPHCPADIVAAIEQLQSYNGSADGERLQVLHDLNRIDKHRYPPVAASLPTDAVPLDQLRVTAIGGDATEWRVGFRDGRRVRENPLGLIQIETRPKVPMRVLPPENLTFDLDLRFGEGDGVFVLDLAAMIDCVESVCQQLSSDFLGHP